jgi:hypothetical protein
MNKSMPLFFLIGLVAGGANPTPVQDKPTPIDTSAKARVEIATKAVNVLRTQIVSGNGKADTQARYNQWTKRLYESKLAAATTKEERIKIIEGYLEGLKGVEKSTRGLVDRGELMEVDVLEWQYEIVQVESTLARCKAE